MNMSFVSTRMPHIQSKTPHPKSHQATNPTPFTCPIILASSKTLHPAFIHPIQYNTPTVTGSGTHHVHAGGSGGGSRCRRGGATLSLCSRLRRGHVNGTRQHGRTGVLLRRAGHHKHRLSRHQRRQLRVRETGHHQQQQRMLDRGTRHNKQQQRLWGGRHVITNNEGGSKKRSNVKHTVWDQRLSMTSQMFKAVVEKWQYSTLWQTVKNRGARYHKQQRQQWDRRYQRHKQILPARNKVDATSKHTLSRSHPQILSDNYDVIDSVAPITWNERGGESWSVINYTRVKYTNCSKRGTYLHSKQARSSWPVNSRIRYAYLHWMSITLKYMHFSTHCNASDSAMLLLAVLVLDNSRAVSIFHRNSSGSGYLAVLLSSGSRVRLHGQTLEALLLLRELQLVLTHVHVARSHIPVGGTPSTPQRGAAVRHIVIYILSNSLHCITCR